MPATVEGGFSELLSSLRASRLEMQAAASHRAAIEAKMRAAFGASAFFRTGSFGNGTNITGYSDVDYFAVLPFERTDDDSCRTLERVAAALRQRFPLTANIRVNSPGVQLPFGLDGAEHTEIVPVISTGSTLLGYRKFDMPDGNGGWMFSSPESHNAYVGNIDVAVAGNLKPLIRFLKGWRCFRGSPIRSFYLELFAAAYVERLPGVLFDIDIAKLLGNLWDCQLAPLRDPRFSSDNLWLTPCSTENMRLFALDQVGRSADWADEAVEHRYAGRISEAYDRWRMVFNSRFPTYTGY